MNLMNLSAFLQRGDVDVEMIREYDMFLSWELTIGMFVQCKNDTDTLIEGLCDDEEWEYGTKLLVFKGFHVTSYNKFNVTVSNGKCSLAFQGTDIVTDVSGRGAKSVYTVADLVEYELELTHPW